VGGIRIPRHLSGVVHELPVVNAVETHGMLWVAQELTPTAQFELNKTWFRNGVLHAN
jgi:hypothetical protein